MKKIWITWEIQRRNKSLSRELEADLFEIVIKKPKFRRYLQSLIRTWMVICDEKPDVLFVQNPSIVLSLFCLYIRPYFKYRLIVDEHNAGLYPLEGGSIFLNLLAKHIAKHADIAIVTNSSLANYVKSLEGRPYVLQDPLPDFSSRKINSLDFFDEDKDNFNIMYVCSWSEDEPFNEVIKAAKLVDKKIKIYITGNKKIDLLNESVSENTIFTNFISDDDYVSLLFKVDAVMVLTNRDNCLNCGAYEAISVLKPMILSNTQEIRDYFNIGVFYTENDAQGISVAMTCMIEDYLDMSREVICLKESILENWPQKKISLLKTIEAINRF